MLYEEFQGFCLLYGVLVSHLYISVGKFTYFTPFKKYVNTINAEVT